MMQRIIRQWTPQRHLLFATVLSAVTSWAAFRQAETDAQTLKTMLAYYVLLVILWFMYGFRHKLENPRTRQLLQFAYMVLGTVLMLVGLLSALGGITAMLAIFLLIAFLPGTALLRCGLHFNRNEDLSS